MERLGDDRADAAYARAVKLGPEDPLVRLNLAGRFARTGRLNDAVKAAEVTAHLLQADEKVDAQVITLKIISILILYSGEVCLFERVNLKSYRSDFKNCFFF